MSYRPAICSHSLGRAWVHEIPPKLATAASSGLPGIEIFFEDLIYLASSFPGGPTPNNQLLAANQIRQLCDTLSLSIIGIGPFSNCEGLLDPFAKAAKMTELHLWFQIARILGTDIIQIPCTFMTKGVTGDLDIVAADLREIADIGAAQNPPFRFAFENLCFGTFFDTWDKAWAVVAAVDRPNFGMCLDTFNIAGGSWADPSREDGKIENADALFKASMREMAQTIDPKKIFYVQIVDAERLERKLDTTHEFHVDGQEPRMSWSRNCRLFLCEEERGGYLPVLDVLHALCDPPEKGGLGYKGWVSFELFNRSLVEEGSQVPKEHAERAMESWRKTAKRMGWEDTTANPVVARRTVLGSLTEVADISARL